MNKIGRGVVVDGAMQSSPSTIRSGSVPTAIQRLESSTTPRPSNSKKPVRETIRSRSSPAGNQSRSGNSPAVPAPPDYQPFLSPESHVKLQTESIY